MDGLMEDYTRSFLGTAERVLEEVRKEMSEPPKYTGVTVEPHKEYAVVRKMYGDIIHLEESCNMSDDYYTIESYGPNGWYVHMDDLTEDNFWSVWSTWNGFVCGSIYLDDHRYTKNGTPAWKREIKHHKLVTLEELKKATDGTYSILI